MLQQTEHSLIFSFSCRSEFASFEISSVRAFARYIAILVAVFLPMLGSFEVPLPLFPGSGMLAFGDFNFL
jgi:hypothetical protein